MKQIPKEWLVLIIIAILVIGISLFEWNKTSPQIQKRDKDTLSEVAESDQDTSEVFRRNSSDGGGVRKEKEENNVTVIIEYLPTQSSSLIFRIALDTHSVNLDSFDFAKDITLEKNGKSFSPTLLIKQEGGGHHRSVEVNFPTADTPFTIIVKNLSNIPRREFSFEKL